jgi:hypothetical protein
VPLCLCGPTDHFSNTPGLAGRLCVCDERPRRRRAAGKCDEMPSPHGCRRDCILALFDGPGRREAAGGHSRRRSRLRPVVALDYNQFDRGMRQARVSLRLRLRLNKNCHRNCHSPIGQNTYLLNFSASRLNHLGQKARQRYRVTTKRPRSTKSAVRGKAR